MNKIAMWSGPRNISTAMMRSWENRADTIVVDEPLYGPYLHRTKKNHPMSHEIIQAQGKDIEPIIDNLINCNLPKGKKIFYQKHMCQHINNDMDISWIKSLQNVFLIREPKYVVKSFLKKYKTATPEDLGFPQQLRLFNYVKEKCGYVPIVLDTKDFLKNPQELLQLLCKNLGVVFDKNMLSWKKGYRDTDGVWASHWYNKVILSTGFKEFKTVNHSLSKQQQNLVSQCLDYYLEISEYRVLN